MRSEAYRRFTERLRKGRKLAGLTQAEAARLLGFRQAQISAMETGERRVDVVELAKFARLYRKPLKWFVD